MKTLLLVAALAVAQNYQPCDLSQLECRNSILVADTQEPLPWPYISIHVPRYSWIRIVCEQTPGIQTISRPGFFGSYTETVSGNHDVAQACKKIEDLLAERATESLDVRTCYTKGGQTWCRSNSNFQCFAQATGWHCHDDCKEAATHLLNGLSARQQEQEVEVLRDAADAITMGRKKNEHAS